MKKKVEMVMWPTKDTHESWSLLLSEQLGTLSYYKISEIALKSDNTIQKQYLYATVSQDVDNIKEGDWAMYLEQATKDKPDKNAEPYLVTNIEEVHWNDRKIIATTDPKLNRELEGARGETVTDIFPQLSQTSIKEYVSNPDGEFEVEYEVEEYTSGGHQYTKTPTLKLNQYNEVGITSVEKKMYSEEEVESILYQYAEDEHGCFSSKSEIESFNNWIEENL